MLFKVRWRCIWGCHIKVTKLQSSLIIYHNKLEVDIIFRILLIMKNCRWACGTVMALLLENPAQIWQGLCEDPALLLWASFLLLCILGMLVQELGPLQPPGETPIRFLASGFVLVQLSLLLPFKKWSGHGRSLYLPLFLCLWNKMKNRYICIYSKTMFVWMFSWEISIWSYPYTTLHMLSEQFNKQKVCFCHILKTALNSSFVWIILSPHLKPN